MLELGLGQLRLTPDQFWDMTIYELNRALSGMQEMRQADNVNRLVACWYNGMFAQADLKKYSFDKWVKDLEPYKQTKQQSLKQNEKQFKEAQRLWQDSQIH